MQCVQAMSRRVALCLSLDGSMGPGGQKQEADNQPPGEEKEG